MTPEELAGALAKSGGPNVEAILLYGSAAAGDHAGRGSDFNVLVVLRETTAAALAPFAEDVRRWMAEGNRAPVIFSSDELRRSADSFPIEISDMQASHRVLQGADPLAGLVVQPALYRLQLEREWQAKLLALRERYLASAGHSGELQDTLKRSVATFLVLIRATVRLFAGEAPMDKREALDALRPYISFDRDVFLLIDDLRRNERQAPPAECEALFARYLAAVEQLACAVDAHIRKGKGGTT